MALFSNLSALNRLSKLVMVVVCASVKIEQKHTVKKVLF